MQKSGWAYDMGIRKFDIDKGLYKIDDENYSEFHIGQIGLSKMDKNKNGIWLPFLFGKKKDGKICLIFDENSNNSFKDDRLLILDSNFYNSCNENYKRLFVNLKLPQLKLNDDSLILSINPPCFIPNYKLSTNSKLFNEKFVLISSPILKTDCIRIDSINYFISVKNFDTRLNFKCKENLRIIVSTKELEFNSDFDKQFLLKDTFKIGSHFFCVQSISDDADTLMIKELDIKPCGYEIGFQAINFIEKEIFSGANISIDNFKKNYLLLEFWGSWCAPCVALHDTITSFIKKSKKINYLGIALDESINKIKKYVGKNKQINKQIFINIKNQTNNNIISKYRITGFPCFILINNKKNIVYRGEGEKGFFDLLKFLTSN